VKRRGVLENSTLAFAGDLASKAATFLLLGIAARALDGAQFAKLATALASATVLTAVFDCGAQVLLTRDGTGGPESRGALLAALARSRAPLALAGIVVGCAVGAIDGSVWLGLGTVLLAIAGAVQQSLSGALRAAQNLRPEAAAKLAGGVATLTAGGACLLLSHGATPIVFALTAAAVAAACPLALAARRAATRGQRRASWPTLRRALPLGLMALATLAYYRSGTIVLSLAAGSHQTGLFAAASTLGFALLMLGNAITTGLLPRLSASPSAAERDHVTRAALGWTAAISTGVALVVMVTAHSLIVLGFGARYAGAATPLAILAAASLPIAISGLLGTALIAAGHVRVVAAQVAATLVANIVLLAVMAGPLGAVGAALATLGCETLAVAILVATTARLLPGVLPAPPAKGRLARVTPEPQP
jgi:O-antigen/teichoic acid export membrane protein